MREEILRGNRTIFSAQLYDGIREALSANRQVMLFVNRRGYSTFVMCRGCGYVEYCDDCAVTMTYHSAAGGAHVPLLAGEKGRSGRYALSAAGHT